MSKLSKRKSQKDREELNKQVDQFINDFKSRLNRLNSLKEYEPAQMVEDAKKIGKLLAMNKITTTKIRNIHTQIVKINTAATKASRASKKHETSSVLPHEVKAEVNFLIPTLVYIDAREGKKLKVLREPLELLVEKIKSLEDVKTLKKFYDSIISYHKFHS